MTKRTHERLATAFLVIVYAWVAVLFGLALIDFLTK
jgi:hypothetical protein